MPVAHLVAAVEAAGTAAKAAHAQGEPQLPGQLLRDIEPHEVAPSLFLQAQGLALEALAPQAAVKVQAGGLEGLPLHIAEDAVEERLELVGIGRDHLVVLRGLDAGDAVARPAQVGREREGELGPGVHVVEVDRVVARALEVGVAIADACGCAYHRRIEVVDARTVDSGGKRQGEAVEHAHLVAHTGAGHPVVEVGVEAGLVAVGVPGLEVAVLVAQAGTRTPRVHVEGVAGIGCRYLREVVEAVVDVERVGVEAGIVHCGVALVGAMYIFHAGFYLVILGKGACPVKLEGVLEEVLLVAGVIARVAHGGVHLVEVVVHAAGVGAAGRHDVAQGEGLVFHMGLVLVVEMPVEAVVGVSGYVVVNVEAVEALADGIVHPLVGDAPLVEAVGIAAKGHRHQVERVGLPARLDVEEVTGALVSFVALGIHIVARVVVVGHALLKLPATVARHVKHAVVQAGHHLALLGGDVGIGVESAIVVGRDGHRARDAAHARVVHGHDVENRAHTLGVVFCARVGDDLDLLYHAGRYGLEHVFGIARECGVGVAVLVYLEVAAALDHDVVLAVDSDQRYLAQHLKGCVGLGIVVVLHIVGDAVDLLAYHRGMGGDGDTAQHVVGVLYHNSAQVDDLVVVRELEVALHAHLAHGRYHGQVVAWAGKLLLVGAIEVGHAGRHDPGGVAGAVDAHCGIGLALARGVVELKFHAVLCQESHVHTHDQEHKCKEFLHY